MKRNNLVNVFFVLVATILFNTGTAFSDDPGSLVITDQGDVNINGDVNIDGAKKIKIGTDDGVNPYITLDKGEIIFRKHYDGAYREFKPVLRFESGAANSGDTVLIPGYWASTPTIQLFPLQMKVYNPDFPDEDQVFQLQAQNIQPQPGQANMYQFDVNATIIINNGLTIPVSVGTTSSSAATSFYSNEITDDSQIPEGTRQVTVTVQSKSHYQSSDFVGTVFYCETESVTYYIDLQCFYNGAYHTETTTYITSHPSNTYTQRVLQSSLTEHDITKFRFRYRYSYRTGSRISREKNNMCGSTFSSSIQISSFNAYVPPTTATASGTVNWMAIGR